MVDHHWLVGGADWNSYAGTWEIVEPSGPPNLQWIQYYNDGNEPRIRYHMEAPDSVEPATGQGSVLVWPSGETRCWDRQQLDTMECFAVGP